MIGSVLSEAFTDFTEAVLTIVAVLTVPGEGLVQAAEA